MIFLPPPPFFLLPLVPKWVFFTPYVTNLFFSGGNPPVPKWAFPPPTVFNGIALGQESIVWVQ